MEQTKKSKSQVRHHHIVKSTWLNGGEVTASDNKIKAFTGKQGFGIKDQSQGIQDQGSMGENCVLREWKRDRDQFRSQKMHDTKQPT